MVGRIVRTEGPYVAKDATIFSAFYVADKARAADVDEWVGGTGRHPVDGMFRSLAAATSLRVVSIMGTLVSMEEALVLYGVEATAIPGVGNAWLIATDTAAQHAFSMHRLLQPELDAFLELYPKITAIADQRNKLHHKWMEWLGFQRVGECLAREMPCFIYEISRNPDVRSSSPRTT